MTQSFTPIYGSGVTVAPTTTTASSSIGDPGATACITNLGTNTVYVRLGESGVVATTADYPVYPGNQVMLAKQVDDTHVAYITAGDTGSLHIMSGDGE